MAITQLAFQASAATVINPTFTSTDSITLLAGAQRSLIVGIAALTSKSPGPAPIQTIPSVTYGGVPMSLMTRADGAQSFITLATSVTRSNIFLFRLRESELPANGAQNLVIDWPELPSTATFSWSYRFVAWQLQNLEQDPVIRDHRRFATNTSATTLGGTLQPGGPSDAILVHGVSGAAGVLDITIGGAGIVEDSATVMGFGRQAAGKDLDAGTIAGVPFTIDFSSTGTAAVVALRLAEFFTINGAASLASEVANPTVLFCQ